MNATPQESLPSSFPQVLLIASGNRKKREEIARVLGETKIELRSLADYPTLEEPEETELTFAGNARLKALYYAKHTAHWCLADDSGLEVQALDGRPGVRSARYAGPGATDADNRARLREELGERTDREARFCCSLALAQPERGVVFECEGETRGQILLEERGQGGFGYDALFHSADLGMSFAEASAPDKDRVSHRGRALARFVEFLNILEARRPSS